MTIATGDDVEWDGKADRRRAPRSSANDITILSERLQSLHSDVTEIKSAMRDLASAITKLALIEERQQLAVAAQERIFTAMADFEKRLRELEQQSPLNHQTTKIVMAVVIALAGGAIGYIVKGH